MIETPLTLIVGASENPERYSWRAAQALLAQGNRIALLGSGKGRIFGLEIQNGTPEMERPDTITLYLNPNAQSQIMDYLIGLNPRRIIFNPGTENPVFQKRAEEAGIEVISACTLVLLATNTYR